MILQPYPELVYSLFPGLNGRWAEINLNEIAKCLLDLLEIKENIFLNPRKCTEFLNLVKKLKVVDYLWGGYGEDRSTVWQGSYIKPGLVIHRGVDFFVPESTKVSLPIGAKLIHSSFDLDQDIGWGEKVIFEGPHGYFIMGHLKNCVREIGKFYTRGNVIGEIAESEINGGTTPHLHLQYMRKLDIDADGYGCIESLIENFPDPNDQIWH